MKEDVAKRDSGHLCCNLDPESGSILGSRVLGSSDVSFKMSYEWFIIGIISLLSLLAFYSLHDFCVWRVFFFLTSSSDRNLF